MRKALIFPFLLVAACSTQRTLAPQPQKSALSQCYSLRHTPGPAVLCVEPLWVVDGKQLANSDVDLNPSEIESVEVIKGASAIAMYGDAARNGVVIITSKRALKGPAK